jgi:hypothetical protein
MAEAPVPENCILPQLGIDPVGYAPPAQVMEALVLPAKPEKSGLACKDIIMSKFTVST